MRGFSVTILSIVALVAVLLVFSGSSVAAVKVSVVPSCTDLLAGQTNKVGSVCLEVVGDPNDDIDAAKLVVTYSVTEEGWQDGEIFEAHLWIGEEISLLPQTKKGNPIPGHFTYQPTDFVTTDPDKWVLEIPFADLLSGAGDYEPNWCGEEFVVAAHAALQKDNGDGTYQTETGWGDGDRIVEKGNWGTYFTITFTCDDDFTCQHSETAFGDGDATLSSILGNNSWGWQIEYYPTNTRTTTIYAAAGKNDSNKGTEVGTLTISYDEEDGEVTVTYQMIGDFTLVETHLYVGTEWITDDQKGKGNYGYKHEELNGASSDAYTINISGSPIYIVAHAVVCGVFE